MRGKGMRTSTGGIGSVGLVVPNGHQAGVPGGLVPSGSVGLGTLTGMIEASEERVHTIGEVTGRYVPMHKGAAHASAIVGHAVQAVPAVCAAQVIVSDVGAVFAIGVQGVRLHRGTRGAVDTVNDGAKVREGNALHSVSLSGLHGPHWRRVRAAGSGSSSGSSGFGARIANRAQMVLADTRSAEQTTIGAIGAPFLQTSLSDGVSNVAPMLARAAGSNNGELHVVISPG